MTNYQFKDYIIRGDYEIYGKIKSCLIYIIGDDYNRALKILDRMKNNPNNDDLREITKPEFKGNLNIDLIYDGWWHDSFLVN